ncbi:26124_t:CDS:2 [Gigaspora rosea]|nr:26124_t:CDS:2 [Gigaspora rosea]
MEVDGCHYRLLIQKEKFLINLTEVIWYIDIHGHDKFKECYISFLQQQKEISTKIITQKFQYEYYNLVNILTNTPLWKLINVEEYLFTDSIHLILDLCNSGISTDLHKHNTGKLSKFNAFWKVATQFLAEKAADTIVAIDRKHYNTVVHLATAILVNNLLQQIKHKYIPEIATPSAQWFQLQFWFKNLLQISI